MSRAKGKTTKPAKAQATPGVADVESAAVAPPGMTIESAAIDSLTPDPRNARLHSERNLAAIMESLRRFGQQKVIVVDADGVVLAGNGTVEAAKTLGWTHLTVNRSPLRGAEARAFALADNRSAELAEWDVEELERTVRELEAEGVPLELLHIDDKELAALADNDPIAAHGFAPKREKPVESAPEETVKPTFKVIITCRDEAQQRDIIGYCERNGLDYKAPSV